MTYSMNFQIFPIKKIFQEKKLSMSWNSVFSKIALIVDNHSNIDKFDNLQPAVLTWNAARLYPFSERNRHAVLMSPWWSVYSSSPCVRKTGKAVVVTISHVMSIALQKEINWNTRWSVKDSQQSISLCPDGNTWNWMNDCEESVQWHQHESVNARMACDYNHVLNLQ